MNHAGSGDQTLRSYVETPTDRVWKVPKLFQGLGVAVAGLETDFQRLESQDENEIRGRSSISPKTPPNYNKHCGL